MKCLYGGLPNVIHTYSTLAPAEMIFPDRGRGKGREEGQCGQTVSLWQTVSLCLVHPPSDLTSNSVTSTTALLLHLTQTVPFFLTTS